MGVRRIRSEWIALKYDNLCGVVIALWREFFKGRRKELHESNSPVHNDYLGKRYKHGENAVGEDADDTSIRSAVCSLAKVTVTQENYQEESNEKSG